MPIKSALRNTLILIFTPFLYLLIFVSPVAARDHPFVLSGTPSVTISERAHNKQTGFMQACEARQAAIKNRLAHLIGLASNIENKFGVIEQRVEDFYTSKVVPTGKTLANYDALVADTVAKKDAVTSAIAKATTDANAFSCSLTDPKGQIILFTTDMKAVKSALKDYRTSIRNLIVAVHSLTGEESSGGTLTPKPTE